MADPFVAEIRIFPFNFAPRGWAWCNGQILPISQNTALFSLLGTTYGGDGKSTFALPNLQGSAPMHTGGNQPGPGLTTHFLGETGGSETVTLLESEIPAHSHLLRAYGSDPGDHFGPTGTSLSRSNSGQAWVAAASLTQFSANAISVAGGSLPHNNMMPYLTYYFNIALQGVFPPRS
jgi:microcystin-dependent protein